MKRRIFTVFLAALLLCTAILSGCTHQPPTEPTPATASPETAPPETEPVFSPTAEPADATTESTEAPTEPPTEAPTEPGEERIGKLYTRNQLEAMENEQRGYGPGPNRPQFNNRPEYALDEQKRFGKYDAHFIAPDNGKIYLTFDCGYDYKTPEGVSVTEMILDVLKEKGVKGTFFVTLGFCKTSPQLVKRMINEGHTVGNHTHHHKAMPTLTIDEMVYEITSVHNYVLENFGYKMHLFRPPEGAFSTRTLALTQSLGYQTVHWSFAHRDWDPEKQPDIQESLKKVLDKAHSGAIYLLHAQSLTNATLLPDAIDGFLAKGFTIDVLK